MKEKEYIAVSNLAKIGIALTALRDVLPGFDGVVEEQEWKEVISKLAEWQKKANEKIDVHS